MKLFALGSAALAFVATACQNRPPLPHPSNFKADHYLGEWYEIARLPVFYQPDNTLAKATYSPGEKRGEVAVLNQSFDASGRPLKSIRGTATLEAAPPPGRFTVRFPGFPSLVAAFSGPNYHVLHVDTDYRSAVVGIPSRKALWILSRERHLSGAELERLVALAREAGFDTGRLLIARWP